MNETNYFMKQNNIDRTQVKLQPDQLFYTNASTLPSETDVSYLAANFTRNPSKSLPLYGPDSDTFSAAKTYNQNTTPQNTFSYPKYPLGADYSQHQSSQKGYYHDLPPIQSSSIPSLNVNSATSISNFDDTETNEFSEKIEENSYNQTLNRQVYYLPSCNVYSVPTTQPTRIPIPDLSSLSGAKENLYYQGNKQNSGFSTPCQINRSKNEGLFTIPLSPFNAKATTLSSLKEDIFSSEDIRRAKTDRYRKEIIIPHKSSAERKKEVFLNTAIINCLLKFLSCNDVLKFRKLYFEYRNDKKYKKIFQKKLELLVLKLSKEDQYSFWNSFVDFKKVRHEHQFAFTQQFVRKCEYIRDISKDLDRTFPDYDKFSTTKGKDSLLKVLVAIANTVKDVGYIQGLNSVAGVFLFFLKEEESFWILLYFMEQLQAKEIFKSDFEKVSTFNYQLEAFVSHYLPAIRDHLNKQAMSLSYFTTQWFITLYSYSLDIPVIIKIWNIIFIRGFTFLIQFGLAILSKYQDDILSMNIDEVGFYIKEQLKQIRPDDDSLFISALNFKVTKRLMKELEYHYLNGKPNVTLVFEANEKPRWQKVPENEKIHNTEDEHILKINTSFSSLLKTPQKRDKFSIHSRESKTPKSSRAWENSPIFQHIVHTFTSEIPTTLKNIFTRKKIDDLNSNKADSSMGTEGDISAHDIIENRAIKLNDSNYHDSRRGSNAISFSLGEQSPIGKNQEGDNQQIYEQLTPKRGLQRGDMNSPKANGQLRVDSSRRRKLDQQENSRDSIDSNYSVMSADITTDKQLGVTYLKFHSRKQSLGSVCTSIFQEEASLNQNLKNGQQEDIRNNSFESTEFNQYDNFGGKTNERNIGNTHAPKKSKFFNEQEKSGQVKSWF